MKLLRLVSAAALLSVAALTAAAAPRAQLNLNADWTFFAGDEPSASQASFPDAAWSKVSLPHTWNAKDGADGGNDYRRGAGWYRRHLRVDPSLGGHQLYLQFDGASLMADVWVNGEHLGTHRGGMSKFRFDVTKVLKVGADNVIAVRVDNAKDLGFPPTSADFTFYGGLYRSVWLLSTDPVQISATDHASPGVYLSQRRVYPNQADLDVLVKVENHEGTPHDLSVRMTILDAAGKPVQTASTPVSLAAGASGDVRDTLVMDHPHLWNGRADPYLYTFRTEIVDGGQVRDVVDQPLGLRFYSVDPNRGFFLNGRYLDLHGVDRHQDVEGKGWAISAEDDQRDFALIMEIGATAIRCSHYEHSDTWYSLCDKGGIVTWAEFPFVNDAVDTPQFQANAEEQLTELIRQQFNHPAICFWGVGNETKGAVIDRIISHLAAVVRREDPSRLSTYAQHMPTAKPPAFHTDVVGFNRYNGWYNGTIPSFAAWADQSHADYPDLRFAISEYGAGAAITQHEEHARDFTPKGKWHPEEYQAEFHEAYWQMLKARPYIWGKFIWCMFDFGSDGRNEGDHPGRNDKGLVTYDRLTKKDAFFWYKANWSSEPVLYIAGRRFTQRTSAATEIKVYSNAPEVSVTLNGRSLGTRQDPTGSHLFVWQQVSLLKGANHVEARASVGGSAQTDSCDWTLGP